MRSEGSIRDSRCGPTVTAPRTHKPLFFHAGTVVAVGRTVSDTPRRRGGEIETGSELKTGLARLREQSM